nr:hypothetical protein [Halogeometricum borinquense]
MISADSTLATSSDRRPGRYLAGDSTSVLRYVRSVLTWAMYEGLIPTNPAKTNHAEGPFPTDETETDQQY